MKTILIIDDDAVFLRLMEKVLSRQGYRVQSAADGRTGLQRFKTLQPDVVITDIFMPGMDGLEVITELAKAGQAQKVIAVTGKATSFGEMHLNMARMMTAAFTLEKPVDMKELRAAIDVITADDPLSVAR